MLEVQANNPATTFAPFATTTVRQQPHEKAYDKMSDHQKRWANIIRRRTDDPSWRCGGQTWDQLKWELHYLAGYTLVPARDKSVSTFASPIEPIKSVGLLVLSHFWGAENRSSDREQPEVGLSVRLYRTTYDDKKDELCFGFDGDSGPESASILAKNLAMMPQSGAIGPIFDPDAVPVLLDTALLLANHVTAAATEEGRALVEEPTFPPCLLGFKPDSVPKQEDADFEILRGAALRYLSLSDGQGNIRNGQYLKPLSSEVCGEIKEIRRDGQTLKIIVGQDAEIILPITTVLRPNVQTGNMLEVGQIMGDFVLPSDVDLSTEPWESIRAAAGEFGADWLLDATYESNIITVNEGTQQIVCVPHALFPKYGSKSVQKYLDLRGELGRDYVSIDNPGNVDKRVNNEARLHVMHLGQASCAEMLQFAGPGFRADLAGLRDYWAKHFRAGRAPKRRSS